ncbi:MAG: flavodoxin [Mangrovibacterium sp.]
MYFSQFTFLAENDFKGKTILPFITHEGSRLGSSVEDIKAKTTGVTVLEGLPIRGSNAKDSMNDVKQWLKDSGMIKRTE